MTSLISFGTVAIKSLHIIDIFCFLNRNCTLHDVAVRPFSLRYNFSIRLRADYLTKQSNLLENSGLLLAHEDKERCPAGTNILRCHRQNF